MPPKPRIRVLRDLARSSNPTPTPASRQFPPKPPTTPTKRTATPLKYKPPPPKPPPKPTTYGKWEQVSSIFFFKTVPVLGRFWLYGFAALMPLFFVRDTFTTVDRCVGASMAPTLSPYAHERGEHERVLIDKRVRWWRKKLPIHRGDIVTFWKPHRPGELSIKRVVAVAGDTVYPKRGYAVKAKEEGTQTAGLYDGLPVRDPDAVEVTDDCEEGEGKVVVPYGHVWVEGDNWRSSYDSNDCGPVSLALLDGRVTKVWRNGFFKDIPDRKDYRTRIVQGREAEPETMMLL